MQEKRWTRWGKAEPSPAQSYIRTESLESLLAENPPATGYPGIQLRQLRNAAKVEGSSRIVTGFCPYNALSKPMVTGFREMYAPGCFSESIESEDIRALVSYDPSKVLGRKDAGTLRVWESGGGIHSSIDIPRTSYGDDLLVSMRRGDIDGLGLAFVANEVEVRQINGDRVHVVTNGVLVGISIVTFGSMEGAKVVTSSEIEAKTQAAYSAGLQAGAARYTRQSSGKVH